MLHVRRKMIMFKAKKILDDKTTDPASRDAFIASRGWCEKFMSLMNSHYSEKQQLRRKIRHI